MLVWTFCHIYGCNRAALSPFCMHLVAPALEGSACVFCPPLGAAWSFHECHILKDHYTALVCRTKCSMRFLKKINPCSLQQIIRILKNESGWKRSQKITWCDRFVLVFAKPFIGTVWKVWSRSWLRIIQVEA